MRLAERVLPWRILRRKTAGWPLMRMIGWDLAGACGAGAWGVGALLAMVLLSRLPREFYGGLPESVLLILLGGGNILGCHSLDGFCNPAARHR